MLFTEQDLQSLKPTGQDYYYDEDYGGELPRYQFGRVECDLDGYWYLDGKTIDYVDSIQELKNIIDKYSSKAL